MKVLPNATQENSPAAHTSQLLASERKDLSRGMGIDMSPEAVARRFDLVDELRELAEELANAKRLGPVNCDPTTL
ncbi:MAG: hypothetical protein SFV81_09830 [Pirellulaceae bacterium]|nr:hypothetical protein [Pirellulaceae bacterium]